jgi:hypothetical protein
MINLKACTRCGGDLLVEDVLGDVELVCLQCGHRSMAPAAAPSLYTVRRRTQEKVAA